VGIGYHRESQLFLSKLLDVVILVSSSVVACLFTQVKIQKESEVRLKIIGTRVDATETVSLLLSMLSTVKCNFECSFCNLLSIDLQMATTSQVLRCH